MAFTMEDEMRGCRPEWGGFASDDEDARPRRPARDFGVLPGDRAARRKPSGVETLEYGVRQNSGGPRGKRVRYIDSLTSQGRRPTPAQTQPRMTYACHMALLSLVLQHPSRNKAMKSDLQLLREQHRFLRSEADDDGSWESELAKRYYDRLFKEYVICDLAGYKRGEVGLRWRTQEEVVKGKGQFRCGHKRCESDVGLRSYEVDFQYDEAGVLKRALVKARLCEDCAYKLHYRRLKADSKRRKAAAREERSWKRVKKRGDEPSLSEKVKDEVESDPSEPEVPKEALVKDSQEGPSEADRRLLESMAWRGPDPEARAREDDFDDYLQDLFA